MKIRQGALNRMRKTDNEDREKFYGHVLVADDSETNQLLIKVVLERMGLDVTVADSGEEAVDKALNQPFDLIILDIMMPNMSGYAVAEKLRIRKVKTPIIAWTSDTSQGSRGKCLEAGCSDYMGKPLNRQRLIEILSTYLSSENRLETDRFNSPASGFDEIDDTEPDKVTCSDS